MPSRKQLDMSAMEFADKNGDSIGEPLGVHNGWILYDFTPADCTEDGFSGVLQFIVVNVDTGEARYQTADEIDTVNTREILDHLDPIPE